MDGNKCFFRIYAQYIPKHEKTLPGAKDSDREGAPRKHRERYLELLRHTLGLQLTEIIIDIADPFLHARFGMPIARIPALPHDHVLRRITIVFIHQCLDTLRNGTHRISRIIETGMPARTHALPLLAKSPIIVTILPIERRHAFPPIRFFLRDGDHECRDA